MDKFVFVCYEHGTGGERLAVMLSKIAGCELLEHEVHGKRTWSYDHFNKLFLKKYDADWKKQIVIEQSHEAYKLIPSHYRPEILRELFPNALYVVINAPRTKVDIDGLHDRIYNNVWQTTHPKLSQKVGYFVQNAGRDPNRDELKLMSKDVTNGQIQCLIRGVPLDEDNIEKVFAEWLKDFGIDFEYVADDKLYTVNYVDLMEGKTQDVTSWLTNKVNHI